jgi:protein required for attachment to host cells
MPLPHKALVLVADGRKMLFLRNHGDENQIDLRTEDHDERDEASFDRELKTDAPGVTFQSGGYGHSTYEETDFKQQNEDRWVKDAAEELNRRALANDFDDAVVILPPKALGVFRKELHKEAEKRILATINKEMSGRPTADIEKLVLDETKASEPSAV